MADETERIEALTQEMSELTRTVAEHNEAGARATLDIDVLADKLMGMIDERDRERQKQAREDAPIRRFEEGEEHPPEKGAPAPRSRYDEMLEGKRIQPVDLWLTRRLLDQAAFKSGGQSPKPSKALNDAVGKIMGATESGYGDELVPEGMASALWADMFLASKVAALPTRVEMPTDPFKLTAMGDPTWRKGVAGEATSASDLATTNPTLTSTEQVTEVDWEYNLDEDAVIAMMPSVREYLVRTGAEQMDAFVLNADDTATSTGNVNLDDDTPPTDAYYLSAGDEGIRHLWIVDNTGQTTAAGGDALTDADMTGMLQDMGKYGVDPALCAIVTDPKTYLSMRNCTNVATYDKFREKATILTGELTDYMRIPVIVSSSHPLGESDGKVCKTAGSNTLGSVSAFARPMWAVGFRRQLLIEVDRDIQKRAHIMVASFRIAIACRGTRSSATHTAGIANILV